MIENISQFKSSFQYRADIDGLRAIAVLAVLFYHADFGFAGGYVGVDVFFVISGYLITSLIIKDLQNDTFTFKQFWARRIRRIFPPLVVVTLVTVIAGWFILLPSDFYSLGKATASQSVFAANVHYWLDSGYFTGNAEEKPLLHTWSLAVEEQFYLIAPIVFWYLFKKKINRQRILELLSVVFIISFIGSIYGVERSPSATFYLLPTRAWEIGMGSILAFLPQIDIRRKLREFLSISGLILIFLPVIFYTKETAFPGLAAFLPCLGTALIIYARNTIVSQILSLRPIVFIGLISYSLYLWHWVFLAYAKYASFSPPSAGKRLVMVLAGVVCAYLSYRFVETPFRTKQIAKTESAIYIFGIAGILVVFAVGFICVLSEGFPQRFAPEKLILAQAIDDIGIISEIETKDVQNDNLLTIGAQNKTPALLIWGDSHAMSTLSAFDQFLKERNLSGKVATHSATAPILGWYNDEPSGLKEGALAFNSAVVDYIRRQKIKNVVMISYWGLNTKNADYKKKLLQTVKIVQATGAKVWVILSHPIPNFKVPTALSRHNYPLEYLNSFFTNYDFDEQYLDQIRDTGASVIDPKPEFLDKNGNYIIQADGIALYRDNHHLSKSGADKILLPFIRKEIRFQ